MWLDFLLKKIKYLATFLSTNAGKYFCTEAADLEVDLLLCWPTLVQLEYISPIMNFKCCMQRERTEIMKMKHWVPSCCGSGGEHCPAEVLHPALVTTTSPTHQALQLIPRGGNWALPKLTPTRAGQGGPSHTQHTLTLCRECWNPACKSKANSLCLRIHMLAENTKAKFLPGLHCKIFVQFYQCSTISPFSVLTRLPCFSLL